LIEFGIQWQQGQRCEQSMAKTCKNEGLLRLRAAEVALVQLADQPRVIFWRHVVNFLVVRKDDAIGGGELMALRYDVKQNIALCSSFRLAQTTGIYQHKVTCADMQQTAANSSEVTCVANALPSITRLDGMVSSDD
jgi:hypothetical protein